MRVKDKGPLPWIGWAFFSWQGKMKRLPYMVSFAILFFLTRFYQIATVPLAAEYFFPPPGGAAIDVAYIVQLAASPQILPFYIPLIYMYTVLDIKRLRSVGGPLFISVLFAVASFVAPVYLPKYAEMLSLSIFAYHAILAVLPAQEDRISPYERKYRVWQTLFTGDGTPRRLNGKEIKHWHIVSSGKK